MKSVYDILKELGEDNGKIYKENVVRKHKDNETFRRFVYLTLNPFINFYQRKIPEGTRLGEKPINPISLDTAMDVLEQSLAPRKVTGDAAKILLRNTFESLNAGNQNVLIRMLDKQIGEGVSEGTIEKVWPKMIPSMPCMLASQFDEKLVAKIKWPAVAQTKMDGMRCELVVREERGAIFFSRNGRELDLLGSMDESVARLIYHLGPNFVMDGELVVVRDGKILDRKTGNGILNKASKGTISKEEADMVHMVVWDLITYEGFDKGLDKTPYKVRLTSLQHAIDGIKRFALVNTKVVDTFEETQAFYSEQRMQGQEGIILKSADGPWEDKRSKHLIKFKAEEECDLVITGWEEGTGKYKGMCGALIGETRDGKVVVGVGSGFTAAERASIGEEVIGKIMAVKYNAVIQDKRQPDLYSLFLPIFVEVRTDKTVADKFEDLK